MHLEADGTIGGQLTSASGWHSRRAVSLSFYVWMSSLCITPPNPFVTGVTPVCLLMFYNVLSQLRVDLCTAGMFRSDVSQSFSITFMIP